MYLIIGTAGHVDHGKTQLIQALTGKDTDRLVEEKDRGISVDLGFAPFELPSGRTAGVVDVPGHEKFIHNMLAGIAGIDLVLLVIDVNEGIMPQTKEHLAIMELLQIKSGIIVLTKIDLAQEEWTTLMEEEVRESLEGTFLEAAPLLKTSVKTGEGLELLKTTIDDMLVNIPPKDEEGPVRMPIDRAFKISGFGTIVTGTLISGTINKDEALEIVPGHTQTRARQLQVHGQQVESGKAGQRLAVNLPNISAEKLERGYILSEPGYFAAEKRCDVRVSMISEVDWELKNGSPIHLHVGAGETVARIYFYGQKRLLPGESGLAQLRLNNALPIFRKDKFIIRSYSPVTTIGGGTILEHRAKKKPLNNPEVIERLALLEKDDPTELIHQIIKDKGVIAQQELEKTSGIRNIELKNILDHLIRNDKVQKLDTFLIHNKTQNHLFDQLKAQVHEYHHKYPLRPGKPKVEASSFFSQSGMDEKAATKLIERLSASEDLELKDGFLIKPGFHPNPSPEQENIISEIVEMQEEHPFQPYTVNELAEQLNQSIDTIKEILDYLVLKNEMIKITEEIYFLVDYYEKAKNLLEAHFSYKEKLTIGEWRDLLGTSRKYALPLLEYFDRYKITKREGDYRVYIKKERKE